jgi:hypothetical protein
MSPELRWLASTGTASPPGTARSHKDTPKPTQPPLPRQQQLSGCITDNILGGVHAGSAAAPDTHVFVLLAQTVVL